MQLCEPVAQRDANASGAHAAASVRKS
jgi:hypothetical protein